MAVTLYRWTLPFIDDVTLYRWALPFIDGPYPL